MAHRYIVDAHAVLWFLEGSQCLSLLAKNILSAPNSQLVLPIIALAEATLVIERGRTTISGVPQFLLCANLPSLHLFPDLCSISFVRLFPTCNQRSTARV